MGFLRLLYQRKSLILFCLFLYLILWLLIGILKQSISFRPLVSEKQTSAQNKHIIVLIIVFFSLKQSNRYRYPATSTFNLILDHLVQSNFNVLLVDPYVLNYIFYENLPFEDLENPLITFGVHEETVEALLQSFHGTNFTIKISESTLSNYKTSIDHVFIEHEEKSIHLAVLHKFNSYYLINENKLELPDAVQLSYGDTLRAVDP